MNHHKATVTQEGVTKSQPSVGCSVSEYSGKVVLNVYRNYPNLKNSFGGLGKFSKLDADGKAFKTSDEAFAYAKDHGYLREYFTDDALRSKRKKAARNPNL